MSKRVGLIALLLFLWTLAMPALNGLLLRSSDSELTVLMRDIFDEAATARKAILTGKKPKFKLPAEKILTAQPSFPEKTDNATFRPSAEAYLKALNNLKEAQVGDLREPFNSLVDACMNCHREVCPGPTFRIKKLYLK